MTEGSDPIPLRIGDTERDRAAEYLRDHLAAGRLDQFGFEERLTTALTAKTMDELDPLFNDLPGPRPGQAIEPSTAFTAPPWQNEPSESSPGKEITPQQPSAQPVRKQGFSSPMAIAAALVWPAALIFCFATGWEYWWVILIPIFFPWWLNKGNQQRARQARDDRRRDGHGHDQLGH